MRYYPFGSGSITTTVVSSSVASFATRAELIIRVTSASIAISGNSGSIGPTGPCIYVSGSSGSRGPNGPDGPPGTVFGPV